MMSDGEEIKSKSTSLIMCFFSLFGNFLALWAISPVPM